ncbi:UPF0280 family protein [Roseovarius sp.]|uniref:UPF0280 family protein n=1 Tax=Roseovarius sp. TaxID=1486281 RepID=UPI0026155490|nr:UPF0280 family protein [Roseovarius sp.]
MTGPQITRISGGRLHLNHGPIDMIVGATGPGQEAGYARAAARFDGLLQEIVDELPRLRMATGRPPKGRVARRMARAVAPFTPQFVTPMAAVAGAGAEEILATLCDGPGIVKAYVNNGGDIAFHLTQGQVMQGVVAADPVAQLTIGHDHAVRGLATSGRGGRSLSRGIAESVTVLAATAAAADAAATMIANAVDCPGHPEITRLPAIEVSPDSDLGARLVTCAVGHLTSADVDRALGAGVTYAETCLAGGLIAGAVLMLEGQCRVVGDLPVKTLDRTETIDA